MHTRIQVGVAALSLITPTTVRYSSVGVSELLSGPGAPPTTFLVVESYFQSSMPSCRRGITGHGTLKKMMTTTWRTRRRKKKRRILKSINPVFRQLPGTGERRGRIAWITLAMSVARARTTFGGTIRTKFAKIK